MLKVITDLEAEAMAEATELINSQTEEIKILKSSIRGFVKKDKRLKDGMKDLVERLSDFRPGGTEQGFIIWHNQGPTISDMRDQAAGIL